MPFVLGLDLDGVTGGYIEAFRESAARDLGVDPASLPDPSTWEFDKAGWGIRDTDHYLELHANAVSRGLFRWMPPMPGAHQALWALSDSDVHIRVITHRLFTKGLHRTSAADTVEWLELNEIPYRDLCFVGDKVQVGADVYIDDAPHNVKALRESGAYVITFDAPYNRGLEGPRARDWDEARDLVLARKALHDADSADAA